MGVVCWTCTVKCFAVGGPFYEIRYGKCMFFSCVGAFTSEEGHKSRRCSECQVIRRIIYLRAVTILDRNTSAFLCVRVSVFLSWWQYQAAVDDAVLVSRRPRCAICRRC